MQQEKSAMLLRKSRAGMEAEAQELGTLARHEERLDELAKNLGIVVREEDRFREKVSGGDIEDRYEMQRSQSSWKKPKRRTIHDCWNGWSPSWKHSKRSGQTYSMRRKTVTTHPKNSTSGRR